MGIKNLIKLITKYYPDTIKKTKITDYQNKILGIDANLMIYKLVYAIRRNGYDIKNNNIIVTHIHALILKLLAFKKYGIKAIFVYDKDAPHIKYDTLKNRTDIKNKLIEKYKNMETDEGRRIYYYIKSNITNQEILECQELIEIFGYKNIIAAQEADSQLAQLNRNHIIDYIVSDDMDIVLFNGLKLLKKFSVSKTKYIDEINISQIIKNMGNTFSKVNPDGLNNLIEIGVLLGSDYCNNKKISVIKAYKFIKKYKHIKNIPLNEYDNTIDCNHAIKYFLKPPITNIKSIDISDKINKDHLILFLNKYQFSNEYSKAIFTKLII